MNMVEMREWNLSLVLPTKPASKTINVLTNNFATSIFISEFAQSLIFTLTYSTQMFYYTFDVDLIVQKTLLHGCIMKSFPWRKNIWHYHIQLNVGNISSAFSQFNRMKYFLRKFISKRRRVISCSWRFCCLMIFWSELWQSKIWYLSLELRKKFFQIDGDLNSEQNVF